MCIPINLSLPEGKRSTTRTAVSMCKDALHDAAVQHYRHGSLVLDVFHALATPGCGNFGRLAMRAEHGLA